MLLFTPLISSPFLLSLLFSILLFSSSVRVQLIYLKAYQMMCCSRSEQENQVIQQYEAELLKLKQQLQTQTQYAY